MTTPMLTTEHPTEELLAEYVDDRLDPETREPVTDHLASCGECREIVLMATEYQASEVTANVTHGTFGGRGRVAAVIGLAAAAAIVVIVIRPGWLFRPDLDDVMTASRALSNRPSAGRLSGEREHRPVRPTYRGGSVKPGDEGAKVKLLTIAADLAEQESPDPHLVGLTTLLTAEKGDQVGEAVKSLEDAYQNAPAAERDSIATDLAAALIAQARWSSDPSRDHARALALMDEVLKRNQSPEAQSPEAQSPEAQSPEALWNRAVALGSLDRPGEALRAWDDYLKVDPDSQWAKEAKENKSRLQSDF